MGTYGPGPFDSDTAFEWMDSLLRKKPAGSWKMLKEAAAMAHPLTGYGVEELVVAGEVVSWLAGHGKHLPKEHPMFEAWLAKQGACLPAGLSEMLAEKLKEAARMAHSGPWRRSTLDIARRLRLR